MDSDGYCAFANCFVRYETRYDEETDTSSTVAVPITYLPEIYANLESALGRNISSEDKANASEIYNRILYGYHLAIDHGGGIVTLYGHCSKILVTEGYNYARYAAFLPNVSAFLEVTMKQKQSSEKEKTVSGLKLKDLMAVSLEDIHLVHSDEEIDLATICELKNNTLTDAGKKEWSDVLNADVQRIFMGVYGLQIEVGGVKPQRLSEFSYTLAGYCSKQDYEKWVTQESDDPGVVMKQI